VSPKNKGKFGKSKATAIPETDEFISGVDRIVRAIRPHAAKLALAGGLVVVIVLGFTTYQWWQQRKLTQATELYARAATLNHVEVSPPEPKLEPDKPAGDAAKPGDKEAAKPAEEPALELDARGIPKKFASAEQRASAVLAVLDQLMDEYGSTSVAKQARLLQAEALYQLGRYAEASDRFRQYADEGGPQDLVLSAREGAAYSLEAMAMAEKDAKAQEAGLEKALKAFTDMQPQADGPRHDEALYHQGRILTQLRREEQARKTFEQVLADHPDTSLKPDIEMRLPALRKTASK
jgi:predicted negative regulator of RcsB-dependent stress response